MGYKQGYRRLKEWKEKGWWHGTIGGEGGGGIWVTKI